MEFLCYNNEKNLHHVMIIELFTQWLKNKGKAPKTCITYGRYATEFIAFFYHKQKTQSNDSINWAETKLQDLRSFFSAETRRNYSARTIILYRSAIEQLKIFLKNRGENISWSTKQLMRPKTVPLLPKPILYQNIQKMLNYLLQLKDPDALCYYALILLLYGAGLRISEVLSIKKNEWMYSYRHNVSLSICGKGEKIRYVPVLQSIHEAIQRYVDKLDPIDVDKNTPLFIHCSGKPINIRFIQRVIVKMRRDLNLEDWITPHKFRHSCATHLFDNGGKLLDIKDLLGHSSCKTTEIYTKISSQKIRDTFLKHEWNE